MRTHQKYRIDNDLFNISGALRGVDDGYFIQYDKYSGHFEVHNSRQGKETYCLMLPYKTLDRRAVSYVLRSRAERSDAYLAEIERENQRLEAERAYKVKQAAFAQLRI
ncbi:MAG: hypothetical protein FWE62_05430 [Firmicutes bacterium]|nr:hypothetical protein [Bacillota bacterium]